MNSSLTIRFALLIVVTLALACSKKDESGTTGTDEAAGSGGGDKAGAGQGTRLSSGQLAGLMPERAGDFVLYKDYGDFRDLDKMSTSSAGVRYQRNDEWISVHLVDMADKPEDAKGMVDQLSKHQPGPPYKSVEAGKDGDAFVWAAETERGGSEMQAVIADRFVLRLGGEGTVSLADLRSFADAAGFLTELAKAPHSDGAAEEPAWVKSASTTLAAKPQAEEPAEQLIDEVPACEELLSPADAKKACGKSIAVKDSGMTDGKLNLCNHSGSGLIFLLSRHSSFKQAQGAARITAEKALASGQLHVGERAGGGSVAVAPVLNLLLELKSLPEAGGPEAPCSAAQLEQLAKSVIARLNQ